MASCRCFLELWTQRANGEGPAGDLVARELVGPDVPGGPEALAAQQSAFMSELFGDVVSMAGAVIIRRLVGIAHTADMDTISDDEARTACERRALRFGRHLLVDGRRTHQDIRSVVAAAQAARKADGLPA
ncbi:5-methyl thioribose kinase-related protein [Monoraphidium neglectum]|uniref:5-methyl thioribose kinase-related protein n=1 Tax=Monoraphidium neglectum TaxID=145388 RepID=A0A0D2JCB8_9CHLO|nr:5-methyl thioribose kinase-related protein [Monoraphidium neglectum]KIY97332.1 5-methyl thioribose kinase-related protein [Monoraphidium neglectum]|eukprot:XP_013896352.1 5-methyl thioribose kinase-related protein [Monoraphidium neglectum]